MSTQSQTTDPVNILFLGARGCGKTSLLASMFQELDSKGVDMFSAEQDTVLSLQRAVINMKQGLDNAKDGEKVNEGLSGTKSVEEYKFAAQITRTASRWFTDDLVVKITCPYVFTDLPGGWYAEETSKHEAVSQYLCESAVSFLTIDAPALMAKNKSIHEERNKPMIIRNWYKQNLSELSGKHTVIMILSRCERFIKYSKHPDELKKRLKEEYGSLAEMLRSNDIPVYATYVETLGGLDFDSYELDENKKWTAIFKKTGEYQPKNCAAPLMMALEYGLGSIQKHAQEKADGVWETMASWFNCSTDTLVADGVSAILDSFRAARVEETEDSLFEV